MINLNNTDFYTVSEVSQLFGVGEPAVRKYINEGTLPAQKIGRAYFISEDDVRDAMEERRRERDKRLNRRQNTK